MAPSRSVLRTFNVGATCCVRPQSCYLSLAALSLAITLAGLSPTFPSASAHYHSETLRKATPCIRKRGSCAWKLLRPWLREDHHIVITKSTHARRLFYGADKHAAAPCTCQSQQRWQLAVGQCHIVIGAHDWLPSLLKRDDCNVQVCVHFSPLFSNSLNRKRTVAASLFKLRGGFHSCNYLKLYPVITSQVPLYPMSSCSAIYSVGHQ